MSRHRGKALNIGPKREESVVWPTVPWRCPDCERILIDVQEICATITTDDTKDDTFRCIPCDIVFTAVGMRTSDLFLKPEQFPPPAPTGRQVVDFALHGMLFLWKGDRPVVLQVAGFKGLSLPVFTTERSLHRAVREFGLEYDGIKIVTAQEEFLEGTARVGLTLIADVHKHNNKVRYLLLQVPSSN